MQNDEGRMKNGGTLILNPSPVREKEDGGARKLQAFVVCVA